MRLFSTMRLLLFLQGLSCACGLTVAMLSWNQANNFVNSKGYSWWKNRGANKNLAETGLGEDAAEDIFLRALEFEGADGFNDITNMPDIIGICEQEAKSKGISGFVHDALKNHYTFVKSSFSGWTKGSEGRSNIRLAVLVKSSLHKYVEVRIGNARTTVISLKGAVWAIVDVYNAPFTNHWWHGRRQVPTAKRAKRILLGSVHLDTKDPDKTLLESLKYASTVLPLGQSYKDEGHNILFNHGIDHAFVSGDWNWRTADWTTVGSIKYPGDKLYGDQKGLSDDQNAVAKTATQETTDTVCKELSKNPNNLIFTTSRGPRGEGYRCKPNDVSEWNENTVGNLLKNNDGREKLAGASLVWQSKAFTKWNFKFPMIDKNTYGNYERRNSEGIVQNKPLIFPFPSYHVDREHSFTDNGIPVYNMEPLAGKKLGELKQGTFGPPGFLIGKYQKTAIKVKVEGKKGKKEKFVEGKIWGNDLGFLDLTGVWNLNEHGSGKWSAEGIKMGYNKNARYLPGRSLGTIVDRRLRIFSDHLPVHHVFEVPDLTRCGYCKHGDDRKESMLELSTITKHTSNAKLALNRLFFPPHN